MVMSCLSGTVGRLPEANLVILAFFTLVLLPLTSSPGKIIELLLKIEHLSRARAEPWALPRALPRALPLPSLDTTCKQNL